MIRNAIRHFSMALLVAAASGLAGCGDASSPEDAVADRLERLANELGPEQVERQYALRIAAKTVRRGAPVNKVNVTEAGSTSQYDAVAIEIGFLTSDTPSSLMLVVVGWRGSEAERLFHFYSTSETFTFPAQILPGSALEFFAGPSRWTAQSGSGSSTVSLDDSTCPVSQSDFRCERMHATVGFSSTVRLDSPQDNIVEKTVAFPSATIAGIRFLRTCVDIACTVSLVDDE